MCLIDGRLATYRAAYRFIRKLLGSNDTPQQAALVLA
jgi:hypothetical protein